MEVEAQTVQSTKEKEEDGKDGPYLLYHTNTWEREQEMSTFYTEMYFSSISRIETIKVEEIEGEECESTCLLTNTSIAEESGMAMKGEFVVPVLMKEDVVYNNTIAGESGIDGEHCSTNHFSCDPDEGKFTQGGGLNERKSSHGRKKPFVCDQCERRFTQKGNLNQHKLSHEG